MTTNIALKCHCGALKGVARDVSPATGIRLVCMCKDCQAFARYLEREDDILDPSGGTDIFQMTPAQLTITEGAENLGCVRLTEKGLLRWYARCCNTPVGATMASSKFPFVGLTHMFMDHEADGRSREEVLGPVLARIYGKAARGVAPDDAHPGVPIGLIFRSLRFLISGLVKRLNTPTAFFNPDSGEPVAVPKVLSKEAREKLA